MYTGNLDPYQDLDVLCRGFQAVRREETVEFEAAGREKTVGFQAIRREKTVESKTTWR
jgi:hypothetical protein